MGITSALMVTTKETLPLTCFFAEAHTNMPDSKAAAKVIETLDKYIGENVIVHNNTRITKNIDSGSIISENH